MCKNFAVHTFVIVYLPKTSQQFEVFFALFVYKCLFIWYNAISEVCSRWHFQANLCKSFLFAKAKSYGKMQVA